MPDLISDAIAGGRRARARLLAAYTEPGEPPFPGAVALTCTVCERFLIWAASPIPDAPAACHDHAGPGRVVDERPTT